MKRSSESPRRNARWTQLSLRALLLSITAICIGMAIWMYLAKVQRDAVKALRQQDAGILYSIQAVETTRALGELPASSSSEGTGWLERWMGVDSVQRVRGVVLVIEDKESALAAIPHLRTLRGLKVILISPRPFSGVQNATYKDAEKILREALPAVDVTEFAFLHFVG